VRSVLVLSFAAIAAIVASGACGGARPATAPAPVTSAAASPTRAEPVVPSSRQPVAPRNAPLPPGARGRLIPRPGAPASDPLAREWSAIESPTLGDVIVLDRSLRLPTILDLSNKKSDFWSPCVREFVQLQAEVARDALGEALSLYSTSCVGGPVRRVEFQTPPAGRGAPAESYLGLVGALEPNRSELALRAAFHGQLRADRITLIADDARWSSPRIDFDDDDGWEIATLPLTRELARVVRGAADARDVLLRFESARSYEDVTVTEQMKQDLRVMLDALDAINRP
jgi:hypothetical protein